MAYTCITCDPTLKKLAKLLKAIDKSNSDSVTQQLRREYRELIESVSGDGYFWQTLGSAISCGPPALADVMMLGDERLIRTERRAIRYLNIIHEDAARERRQRELPVGRYCWKWNYGCATCAAGTHGN